MNIQSDNWCPMSRNCQWPFHLVCVNLVILTLGHIFIFFCFLSLSRTDHNRLQYWNCHDNMIDSNTCIFTVTLSKNLASTSCWLLILRLFLTRPCIVNRVNVFWIANITIVGAFLSTKIWVNDTSIEWLTTTSSEAEIFDNVGGGCFVCIPLADIRLPLIWIRW